MKKTLLSVATLVTIIASGSSQAAYHLHLTELTKPEGAGKEIRMSVSSLPFKQTFIVGDYKCAESYDVSVTRDEHKKAKAERVRVSILQGSNYKIANGSTAVIDVGPQRSISRVELILVAQSCSQPNFTLKLEPVLE